VFDLGDRQDEAEPTHRLGSPMDDNLQKNKVYEKGEGTEGYSTFRCVGGRKVVDLGDFRIGTGTGTETSDAPVESLF
jgi:hypothetical protein